MPEGNTYGQARIAASDLTPGNELTIIQHPNGIPKVIDSGTVSSISGDKVLYQDIDTIGGSSGSGVLDWQGRLAAVHVQGGCNTSGGNKAVRIEEIIEDSPIVRNRTSQYGQHSTVLATGDFNNDGIDDIALGNPTASVAGQRAAGRVKVLYRSSTGATLSTQIWHQNSSGVAGAPEAADFFGASVSAGDFNGDGIDDLAIGAPGEAIGPRDNAGWVGILSGGVGGLSSSANVHQDSPGILGVSEAGDRFGTSLASGDFNNDGRDDLAIGIPGENSSQGYVQIVYGSATGITATWNQLLGQGNVPQAAPENNDQFGASLATGDFNNDNHDDLAIGHPSEAIGSRASAGAVTILYGDSSGVITSGSKTWYQNVSGIAGVSEAGDRFGTSLSSGDADGDGYFDLVIGIPGENIGATKNAGAIQVLYGGGNGLDFAGNTIISQNGFNAVVEPEDRFGSAVASARIGIDVFADIVIGAPGEAIGSNANAGALFLLRGRNGVINTTNSQTWTQNINNIQGVSERQDRFGSALALGKLNAGSRRDVVVSVPGEEWATTLVSETIAVLFGNASALSSTNNQLIRP